MRKPEEAAPILESTVQIDPHNYVPYANLALAYLMLNRFDDAEHVARHAVDIDRASTKSKLILGLVLVSKRKFTPEALSLLTRAGDDHPQANLLAAEILASIGKLDQARIRVNEYLASGERGARDLAQQWLAIIDNAERETRAKSAAVSHP